MYNLRPVNMQHRTAGLHPEIEKSKKDTLKSLIGLFVYRSETLSVFVTVFGIMFPFLFLVLVLYIRQLDTQLALVDNLTVRHRGKKMMLSNSANYKSETEPFSKRTQHNTKNVEHYILEREGP